MTDAPPELPTQPLSDLVAWWRKTKTRGLIVGGLAVAILGRPRTTQDIDAIVFLKDHRWEEFLRIGESLSFRSRVPDPLAFAEENRVLLARHEKSGIDVDLSLAALPFEREILKRSQKAKIGGVRISIPTAEDLIILKAIANRPRDKIDIEGILERCPKLNTRHIKKEVDRFARLLDMSEIADDIRGLLAKVGKRNRRRKN